MILLIRSDDSSQKYLQAGRFLQRKLKKYMRMRYPLWVLLMEISIVTVIGIQVFPIPAGTRQVILALGKAKTWQTLIAVYLPTREKVRK